MGNNSLDSKIRTIVDSAIDPEIVEARACKEIIENDYAGTIEKLAKANSGLSATNNIIKWVPILGWHVWHQNNYSIKHNNEKIATTLARYMFYKDDQIKDVDMGKKVNFSFDRSLLTNGSSINVTYYRRGCDTPVSKVYGCKTLNNGKQSFVADEDRIDYTNTYIVVYNKENPDIQYDQKTFSEEYDAEKASILELSEKYDKMVNDTQIITYAKERQVDEKKFKSLVWVMKARRANREKDADRTPVIQRQQMLMTQ